MYEKFSRDLDALVDGIVEENIISRESLRRRIGLAMSISFNDIIKKSVMSFKAEQQLAVKQLTNSIVGSKGDVDDITKKIVGISDEIDIHNAASGVLIEMSEYERLKSFVKKKYGVKVLDSFLDTLNKPK